MGREPGNRAPNTSGYGDIATAWSSNFENGTQEFLTLGYTTPVFATGVDVRETNGNGFVTQIDLLDINNVLHTVFTGPDNTAPGAPGDLVVSFAATPYLVKGVKIYVDTNHNLTTYEEIDAVQLLSSAPSTGALGGITVTFSGPVDPATFTAADLIDPTTGLSRLIDPNGNPVAISQVIDMGATNHNVYQIVLANPSNTLGFYRIALGPTVTDFSGNLMDQNQNFINGEAPADIFSGTFYFQPFPNHAPTLVTNISGLVPAVASGSPNTGIDLASFITALGNNIGDPDDAAYAPALAPRGIAVTSVDNTHGTWQYSLDGGTSWLGFGSPSLTAARLLRGNSTTRIRFVPNRQFQRQRPVHLCRLGPHHRRARRPRRRFGRRGQHRVQLQSAFDRDVGRQSAALVHAGQSAACRQRGRTAANRAQLRHQHARRPARRGDDADACRLHRHADRRHRRPDLHDAAEHRSRHRHLDLSARARHQRHRDL